MIPAKVMVDLRKASSAEGAQAAYYAGVVVVEDKAISIDGKTDRSSDNWVALVAEAILEAFEITAEEVDDDVGNLVYAQMFLGGLFCVEPIDTAAYFSLEITDETPTPAATIWRVHAEKIAEDVAERICADSSRERTLEQLTQLVLLEISKTLLLREDEAE